ncbi:MAG TPA: hypothetical protein ENI90_01390 [Methylothermaceae bacterium]|nr:hypothetical protein [Methylothermaceae bacterium]
MMVLRERSRRLRLLLVWLGILQLGAALAAEKSFRERIEDRFELYRSSGQLRAAGDAIVEKRLVLKLYESNGLLPLWRDKANVAAVMSWIDRSYREGLDPADYHRDALTRPDLNEVDRELLLTDALVTLAIHLASGKVDPARLFRTWNYTPALADSLTAATLLAAIQHGAVATYLEGKLPEGIYRDLRAALARYREIRQNGGWPVIPAGTSLVLGARNPRVALLRRRLRASGDLTEQNPADPELFDLPLEQAVRRFQARHLLETDGVVGPRTLAALNVTVERRIAQIRVNLERLRWLYHSLPAEYVGVDLAGFELHVWKGRSLVLSSPIQVGRPFWQTPVFRDVITYIEINPTWTVPRRIARRELVPRLLKDPPGFLAKHNMELLTLDGRVVDPAAVDWTSIDAGNFPFVLRQRPGPNNALGWIKFMFPNPYHVYLHDTPSKALFRRPRRAFSHGCIRVAKPLELAEILLAPNGPAWTRERIQALIDSGRTRTIVLKRPMPILIIYLTAAPDLQAPQIVEFRPDLYHRDAKVLRALNSAPREKAPHLQIVN